jgi:integrase
MMVEGGPVGVLVCPRHKSGDMHRTAVNKEVLEAATSLRARGHFARDWFEKSITAACKAVKCPDGTAGIPVFKPAWFRHTIATRAYQDGAAPSAVSAFLGHKSVATTKRFYATLAVVPKVPTLA